MKNIGRLAGAALLLGSGVALTAPARAADGDSSRTLYQGSVKIKPVSLSKIKAQLTELGCNTKSRRCVFVEEGKTLEIFPNGPGFGPLSFLLSRTEISAAEDISGAPDIEKFKKALRAQIAILGSAVVLVEDSWVLKKTTHPWTAIY